MSNAAKENNDDDVASESENEEVPTLCDLDKDPKLPPVPVTILTGV